MIYQTDKDKMHILERGDLNLNDFAICRGFQWSALVLKTDCNFVVCTSQGLRGLFDKTPKYANDFLTFMSSALTKFKYVAEFVEKYPNELQMLRTFRAVLKWCEDWLTSVMTGRSATCVRSNWPWISPDWRHWASVHIDQLSFGFYATNVFLCIRRSHISIRNHAFSSKNWT